MQSVLQTTAEDLARISKERGRDYDPAKHTAWCGECGSACRWYDWGSFGIMHWPDCSGDESEIRFREAG